MGGVIVRSDDGKYVDDTPFSLGGGELLVFALIFKLTAKLFGIDNEWAVVWFGGSFDVLKLLLICDNLTGGGLFGRSVDAAVAAEQRSWSRSVCGDRECSLIKIGDFDLVSASAWVCK